MDFLATNIKFPEIKKDEDPEKYLVRLIKFLEDDVYRDMVQRINWLLDRVRVTEVKSEDGSRYMVVEFIKPGSTRNDNGNWRMLLNPDDMEMQMRRSGTWTTAARWHG
jgi:hypothetical protein